MNQPKDTPVEMDPLNHVKKYFLFLYFHLSFSLSFSLSLSFPFSRYFFFFLFLFLFLTPKRLLGIRGNWVEINGF